MSSVITSTKQELVGKINTTTLKGVTSIPEWLQPYLNYNGVYVGTEEPTNPDVLIWLNPNGGDNALPPLPTSVGRYILQVSLKNNSLVYAWVKQS